MKNAPTLAIRGVDTTENGPSKGRESFRLHFVAGHRWAVLKKMGATDGKNRAVDEYADRIDDYRDDIKMLKKIKEDIVIKLKAVGTERRAEQVRPGFLGKKQRETVLLIAMRAKKQQQQQEH